MHYTWTELASFTTDINYKFRIYPAGRTLLYWALCGEEYCLANKLLDAGADVNDVNAVSADNKTPLDMFYQIGCLLSAEQRQLLNRLVAKMDNILIRSLKNGTYHLVYYVLQNATLFSYHNIARDVITHFRVVQNGTG